MNFLTPEEEEKLIDSIIKKIQEGQSPRNNPNSLENMLKRKKEKRIEAIYITITVIIFLIIMFLGQRYLINLAKTTNIPVDNSTSVETPTESIIELPSNNKENFTFGRYDSQEEIVIKDGDFITFTNLENNVVDETFILKDGEDVLWESGAVTPGSSINWYPMEYFSEKGAYEISLVQIPHINDVPETNKLEQVITITIK